MLRAPRPRQAGAAVAALALAFAVSGPVPARADEVRDRQRPILRALDVAGAWKVTQGEGVTVAVVDSGVDSRQPDLRGAVTTGPNFLRGIDRGARITRLHGTGMASLIAGRGHGPGRRSGVIGVAPQARLLAVRALAEEQDGGYGAYRAADDRADKALGEAIRYAADHGADVINLSLGRYEVSPEDRQAIAHAIAKGVVVVSAVGNDGDERRRLDRDGFAPYSYPAAYPGVIAVAATDPEHRHADFSNKNYSVLLAAPGTRLPVAGPGGGYFLSDGTSGASALVSGVAALIRARHPRLPPALVAQALLDSTRYGPAKVYDPALGFGEVNAARALRAADRLVVPRSGTAFGKSGGRPFGTGTAPVEVIDRPVWVGPLAVVSVILALGGVAAAVTILVLLYRRSRSSP